MLCQVLVLASSWLIFVVWMLTIPYKGKQWVPPPALYYAASGIMGFAGERSPVVTGLLFNVTLGLLGRAPAVPEPVGAGRQLG